MKFKKMFQCNPFQYKRQKLIETTCRALYTVHRCVNKNKLADGQLKGVDVLKYLPTVLPVEIFSNEGSALVGERR